MKKGIWIEYAVYVILGIVSAVLCACSRDIGGVQEAAEFWGILADSFTVPGVLLSGVGGLSWIASQGNFMMLRYGFSVVLSRFTHPKEPMLSYYDYKLQKEQERKPWLVRMLFTGLGFLVLSGVCLIVYFMV